MPVCAARPSLSVTDMRRVVLTYSISEVRPYINWLYFYHAWQMGSQSQAARDALRADAEAMLTQWDGTHHTHGVAALFSAISSGDDLVLEGTPLPLLRQQSPDSTSGACLCLSDFISPTSPDTVGLFATTIDPLTEHLHDDDPYQRMLAQTLADRLAEATAERLHEWVRREWWGYAPDESLTVDQLHAEAFQGIRPAVGYPSLPDTSINFLIDRLIGMSDIGIRLTEHGAMRPHASVSGLMLAHPAARYFNLGKIGSDQLADYSRRRGIPIELMRKFLSTSLLKK